MRNLRHLIIIAVAGAALIACGQGEGLSDDSELSFATFNLEAEDGGFEPSSETIAFEDDDPAAFNEAAAPMDEPEVDAEVAKMSPALERYEIRLMWGQRKLNPEGEPRAWDGAVSTTVGALRVIRTIRFEQNDKVLPRTSPQSVEFDSTTSIHNDGLRLRLIRPANPTVAVVPELVLTLGNATITIPHAKLNHLVRAKKIDDLGNGVAIMAFRHTGCAKGMVGGHWKRLNKRGGIFGGVVKGADGEKAGKLVGIWGKRQDGKRRFFGLFKQEGEPAGLVRGTYRSLPEGMGNGGMFRGHWVNKDRTHKGILVGHYKNPEGTNGGTFSGIWVRRCTAEDAPGLVTSTPTEAADSPDLCSSDGVCVAEPELECAGGECSDTTDE